MSPRDPSKNANRERGGSRTVLHPDLARSRRLVIFVRPIDYDDVLCLAKGWDVTTSSAAWAIIAERLADLRGSNPLLSSAYGGPDIVKASEKVLQQHNNVTRGVPDPRKQPRNQREGARRRAYDGE